MRDVSTVSKPTGGILSVSVDSPVDVVQLLDITPTFITRFLRCIHKNDDLTTSATTLLLFARTTSQSSMAHQQPKKKAKSRFYSIVGL
jgi:hypothetical protein